MCIRDRYILVSINDKMHIVNQESEILSITRHETQFPKIPRSSSLQNGCFDRHTHTCTWTDSWTMKKQLPVLIKIDHLRYNIDLMTSIFFAVFVETMPMYSALLSLIHI
eukprot:TRINITY_DN13354_c0_g1_i2.p1 TRINITY_DN13354_c0_g1~~TRINITY_DN13354_c0_g1_i2.p1  ORF type:complete len:128 (-),score=20.81 TRINITY_DN13354_c0_g1_i2:60-386(-)